MFNDKMIQKSDTHHLSKPISEKSSVNTGRGETQLAAVYRDGLLNDTLGFWLRHGVDREYGGFYSLLDRDGGLMGTDKYIWLQGRFVWTLATLYHQVEPRSEWLDLAEKGLAFLRRYGFAESGKMYFAVDRQGRPLRMRRYLFSEVFMIMALAAYAQAAQDEAIMGEARALFYRMKYFSETPGLLEPKINPQTRPQQGIVMPMMLMHLGQILRQAGGDVSYNKLIDDCLLRIQRDFCKPEMACVMEIVAPGGEMIDTPEGRCLNPGHAIELAWFLLWEAKYRNNDPVYREAGLRIYNWMWQRGWDSEYGGIFCHVDARGFPSTEYWHDMKFWWPHAEAIIASLLAYQLTGKEIYRKQHAQVHEWAYAHFPDPEYGEWFGYLHRDGSVSSTLKGNQWKGCFHVPRMQLLAWKLLEETRQTE